MRWFSSRIQGPCCPWLFVATKDCGRWEALERWSSHRMMKSVSVSKHCTTRSCIPEGTSILPIIQYPVIMTLHDSLTFSFRLISVSLVGTVSGSVKRCPWLVLFYRWVEITSLDMAWATGKVIFITGRIAAYYAEVFRQTSDLDVFEIHSRMTPGDES